MNEQRDNKLIEEFYKLYSDIDRTAGLTKSKKNRLDRFRNEMAVDFYNLNDDNDIVKFAQKYMYSNIAIPIHNNEMTSGELQTIIMIKELQQKKYDKKKGYTQKKNEKILHDDKESAFIQTVINYHEIFKTIVDKAIDGQEMTKTEIAHMQKKYFGQITQHRHDDGHYSLGHTTYFPLASSWVLNRALYEWVILLSNGLIDIKHCANSDCNKLYIPTGKGLEQKFCSNACKMKLFRKKRKESLLNIGNIG